MSKEDKYFPLTPKEVEQIRKDHAKSPTGVGVERTLLRIAGLREPGVGWKRHFRRQDQLNSPADGTPLSEEALNKRRTPLHRRWLNRNG